MFTIFKLFFHTRTDELDRTVALLDSLKQDLARLMCSLAQPDKKAVQR